MAIAGTVIPRELKPDPSAQPAQPRRQRAPAKREDTLKKTGNSPVGGIPAVASAAPSTSSRVWTFSRSWTFGGGGSKGKEAVAENDSKIEKGAAPAAQDAPATARSLVPAKAADAVSVVAEAPVSATLPESKTAGVNPEAWK